MAQYRVLKKSYIHDKIYEPGEVVEWDGPAGKWLEPIGNERRPPHPSNITGQPGPDPGSPPPQSFGKSEFDPGGPTRATALEEYDKKRLADQEVDIPSSDPQVLARKSESEGSLKATDEGPKVKPLAKPAKPVEKPHDE
jgi:hypothetical protein